MPGPGAADAARVTKNRKGYVARCKRRIDEGDNSQSAIASTGPSSIAQGSPPSPAVQLGPLPQATLFPMHAMGPPSTSCGASTVTVKQTPSSQTLPPSQSAGARHQIAASTSASVPTPALMPSASAQATAERTITESSLSPGASTPTLGDASSSGSVTLLSDLVFADRKVRALAIMQALINRSTVLHGAVEPNTPVPSLVKQGAYQVNSGIAGASGPGLSMPTDGVDAGNVSAPPESSAAEALTAPSAPEAAASSLPSGPSHLAQQKRLSSRLTDKDMNVGAGTSEDEDAPPSKRARLDSSLVPPGSVEAAAAAAKQKAMAELTATFRKKSTAAADAAGAGCDENAPPAMQTELGESLMKPGSTEEDVATAVAAAADAQQKALAELKEVFKGKAAAVGSK